MPSKRHPCARALRGGFEMPRPQLVVDGGGVRAGYRVRPAPNCRRASAETLPLGCAGGPIRTLLGSEDARPVLPANPRRPPELVCPPLGLVHLVQPPRKKLLGRKVQPGRAITSVSIAMRTLTIARNSLQPVHPGVVGIDSSLIVKVKLLIVEQSSNLGAATGKEFRIWHACPRIRRTF